MAENEYTIHSFMGVLIATLVLRGVKVIEIPVGRGRDKLGIRALSTFASDICSYHTDHPAEPIRDDWTRFLVRARNMLSPDSTGTFSDLRDELVQKTTTLVSVEEGYFQLDVSEPHARSILRGVDELLREFTAALVDKFEESSKKKVPPDAEIAAG